MKDTLSTSTVARLLGVAVKSVSNWIDSGDLKAGRTPGGHRRVTKQDLIAFLVRQNLPVPPELASTKPKVLVVDDDEAFGRWLTDELQEAYPNTQVLLAHDGFAAGETVAYARPDAVIVDLRMPGMDGFEVCRRIKGRPETQHVTVIVVSGFLTDELGDQARQAGAQACFGKPVDREALMKELSKVLGTSRVAH